MIWNTLKSKAKELITPAAPLPGNDLRYRQERILQILLLAGAILGVIVCIPSVALSIKEGLLIVAVTDILIYSFILFLLFRRTLSFTFRAVSVVSITYFLGMVLLLVIGPFGGGPVWLFAFPVLAGLFLGETIGLAALLLNAVTILVLGILAHKGVISWGYPTINPMEKWGVTSLNFLLLNTIVTLAVTMVLKGLKSSLNAMKISENRYRRIFDNILDVYFETDLEGRILEISPSVGRVLGHDPKHLANRPFLNKALSSDQRSALMGKLLKSQKINGHEVEACDKTGELRTLSVNARIRRKTEPGRIIGIFRDITAQKKMEKDNRKLEESLNQAKKMEALGLLAGGVAHDLNNILSGIVGYPDLLLMDLPEDSPLVPSILAIQESGEKAAKIVQDLLTLSRRGITIREIVNLNDIISQFLLSPECQKILSFHPFSTIERQLNAPRPYIKGSPVHLSKTIMNLIANGAEAQPQGGTITISTENQHLTTPLPGHEKSIPGEYIVLKVKDHGTGIQPRDLDRIFEPFFTKKVMGRSGTGLGMAVVWGTVQDHGGFIDVQSELEKGTCFTLYFPVTREEIIPAAPTPSLDEMKGKGEPILIVDDILEQREMVSAMLERLNYRPHALPGGEQALEWLNENSADLIILDMIMEPGMDGLSTYEKILEISPKQRAVIASGFSETKRVKKAQELGAGACIKKPYTLEKLAMAIKAELAK